MTRRILAAFLVVGAVLALPSARLSGEPTTSSPTDRAAATTTSTTTTTMRPNPLAVYPRRPGAKYDDLEAPPLVSVTLAGIGPRRTLPRRLRPAPTTAAKERGLADGYTAVVTDTAGAVLHIVVHAKRGAKFAPFLCSATAANDGTVLIPYYRDGQPTLPTITTTSGPTTADTPDTASYDLDLYLPLGSRRGRFYLACVPLLFLDLSGAVTRGVWAIDV